jgi:hypothetical protein
MRSCRVCRGYADDAAASAKENNDLSMRLYGSNLAGQCFSALCWCIGLADRRRLQGDALRKQDVARANDLQKCNECRRYSDEAFRAAKQNRAMRCDLVGPRWIRNAQAHFEWCMDFGTGPANTEANLRFGWLRQCRQMKIQQGTRSAPSQAQTGATTSAGSRQLASTKAEFRERPVSARAARRPLPRTKPSRCVHPFADQV